MHTFVNFSLQAGAWQVLRDVSLAKIWSHVPEMICLHTTSMAQWNLSVERCSDLSYKIVGWVSMLLSGRHRYPLVIWTIWYPTSSPRKTEEFFTDMCMFQVFEVFRRSPAVRLRVGTPLCSFYGFWPFIGLSGAENVFEIRVENIFGI